MDTLTPIEERLLREIAKAGKEGVIQMELWRKLGIDSREGSKILARLEKKGFIKREPIKVNGRRTYRVYVVKGLELVTEKAPTIEVVQLPTELEFLLEVPCFTCPQLHVCGSLRGVNPENCPKLTAWLLSKVREGYE
ncbi:MAG: hypothetical protein DRJ40_00370 [Thermoprotei archaeon]|nr:MAG: hypothetical protein DRJ40_00370 [Thermoprotei archaeon]